MKHRILSLVVAVILCLGVCPVQALMAAEGDVPPVADSGLAQEEAQGAPRKAAARASASEIMISGSYVFARGIPIVIKQNGSITSVYDTAGKLLSDQTDVSNKYIYGGWSAGTYTYTADTSITMESGTVKSLYGGNFKGTLNGNTNIVVQGGAIASFVYGGGNQSITNGNTNVEINGGTFVQVYGGGYNGAVSGTANVTINDGAEVTNSVFGGSYIASAESTNVIINGGTVAYVYGGSNQGTVTGTANVSVNSGATVNGTVYGGGYQDTVNSTNVIINGGTVGNGDAGWAYGGGCSGSVKNTHVQLKDGTCYNSYGGSYEGTVEQATIEMGTDWGGWALAGGYNDTTESVEVIVHNYEALDSQPIIKIEDTTAQKVTVIVRRDDGGPLKQANSGHIYLKPTSAWNIVVEYGTVVFWPQMDQDITLDSLDIKPSAQVQFFGNEGKIIEINKVLCNGGQFLLPAPRKTGTGEIVDNVPIKLGEIVLNIPLIVLNPYGWTDEILENNYFFFGDAVDALDSTDCLFVKSSDAVLKEIPGGGGAKGIYFKKKPEGTSSIYISKAEFNENPVPYNDTISLTVGVAEQPAVDALLPNARIQIRGRNHRDVLFASVQVNEDGTAATVTGINGVTGSAQVDGGYITITLPVTAELLDTREEGLCALATTPDNQYSNSVQLLGPNGEKEIEITPAPITLSETVSEPAFSDSLESDLENGAFYTASVQWYPVDGGAASAFQLNRDYQADIILTPKEGHWLSAASIGNTVEYNGKSVACVFNSDGTVTLENLKSARFEGRTITVIASPAEGGTVTGGGVYAHGTNVTVTATPAQGWKFTGWKENGVTVSEEPAYTFTASANRTLTAHFEQEQTEEPTKKVKTDALTTVPGELVNSPFNTVDKIIAELRQKVEAAISEVGDSLVVYDVRLVYEDDGREVEPGNFPKEGIDAILDYPSGTNDTDYIFTVQHMISYGPNAGQVETLTYTAEPTGLKCHFSSLSPVAIGWQKKTAPAPDPTTPTGGSSSSDSDEDNDRDDFWQEVLQQIEQAKPGATLRINAKDRDKLPRKVMNALKQSGITLVIRWSGGEDIVLSSDQALDEPRRFFYPLAYLSSYDFDAAADTQSPDTQNPDDSLSEAAASVNQNPATGDSAVSIALLLSAAACGGIWVCKGKKHAR